MAELQTKYRNMKLLAKKQLASNTKEMKLTGGGQANLVDGNDFGFVTSQISGLTNRFDDDFDEENDEYADEVLNGESSAPDVEKIIVEEEDTKTSPKFSKPSKKFMTGKARMSAKDDLITLKIEGMQAENEYKKLLVDKTKLEIEKEKILIGKEKLLVANEELLGKKLKLEIQIMEKQVSE